MLHCDEGVLIEKIKYNILVVEDSELINKTIVKTLSKFGCYDIDRSFSFEQAREKLSNNDYAFIILDLNLPDAYGEELVSDIKNMSSAKIIILTVEVDVQMRESLFKLGILDYLVKDKNFLYSINSIDKVIQSVSRNRGNTILIVDDSMFICKQTQSILSIRDYKTEIAQTAHDGFEILKSKSISTIILDMELPDRHGLELLRDIKKIPELTHIPVVIISANDNPETVRDAFKLGVSYFIKKPFNVEELILKVDLSIDVYHKDIEILCKQKILNEYKDAVDDSSIVSKTDTKGIITFVNDRFCEISGYSRKELIGKPHNIVRHPDMPASIFKEIWETISSKKRWNGKVKNLKKDGSYYWVESTISPIVDYDGNIVEYISIRVDITELEYIKHELEESLDISNKNFLEAYKISQEYQKAIELTNIVIRVGVDEIITHVNDKFCEVLGYEKEEIIGKHYKMFKDFTFSDEDYIDAHKKLSSGEIWRGQVQTKAKNGKPLHFETTAVPIIDKRGNILEALIIRQDVTEIITLHEELEDTQKEIIFKLGEVGETRSKETGQHVKRVAEYSKLLADLMGINRHSINLLYTASPMHDIGKVGIPDSILKKPAKLNDEEWEIMKTHSKIGFDILKNSKRDILRAAAIISYTHHEKYDGTGYPNQIKGENIHIFGRITALADVFDALGSDRVYKKAWELDRILDLIKQESGKHFDPKLVDTFLNNLDQFLEIRDKFQDI